MKDVIIIGAGPSGVSAAIYLKRFNRDVLVIESGESSLHLAAEIDNYYGYKSISGSALYTDGLNQLAALEIECVRSKVLEINFNQGFEVVTKNGSYESKIIVLATGKAKNKLTVPNYQKYEMKGLSYCAVCDGFFYRNKTIGLIGSGEYMEHELTVLARMSKDITIFTNGVEYENSDYPVVKEKITGFMGDSNLEGIITENGEYLLSAVFVALGNGSTFDFIKHLGLKVDTSNNIVVDENFQTNIPGLYAVGDAIGGILQVNKASTDGMKAAFAINKILKE